MEVIIESILFPLFLLHLLFLQRTACIDSAAITTISSTQFLNDGETITSLNGSFTLGFFSPGNSMSRYLGIWYTKVTQQTVVWVANRESPLNRSSGVVKISSDGNLVLVDDKNNNNLLWSTNVPFSSNNSIAQLLDSGNLVLIQSEDVDLDNILWQSFDHPSNTFLAGMKIGLNLKTRENDLLTAWKNSNDPASGSFSLGFDLNKVVQVVIWNGSNKFWRSGQWNGQIFTGIPDMTSYHLYGFNIINSQEEGRLYCSYVNRDNSTISSFVLSTDGKLERFYWNFNMSRWDLVWSQPNSECEMYGRCGPNGSCNRKATSICSCLSGFKPRAPQEWNSGNWSGGCVRKNELNCNLPNEFLKLSGMKYPDDSKSMSSVEGADVCEARCRSNCFCVAYAYDNGLGCMVWEGDLKDIQKFPKGGQDIYLRFNKSDLKKRKEGKLLIVMLLVALGLVMLFVYIFFTWRRLQREREREIRIQEHSQELRYSDLGTVKNSSRYSSDQTELIEHGINKGKGHDLPTFGLDMIQIATDSFSYANKLGQGGFGPVYKGQLPSGQEIAVKRLSNGSGQGMMEFENEVILIAKLQHRNLVRLLGCCMQGEERMLVYEYMSNKSLDAFLFDQKKRAELNWKTRFYIIEGIARGLLYLHRDSRLRIIHRDLKASNILLDADMNPKISDFGMARIFGGNQIQANTMRVVGTYGYLAPEYAMEGLFSVKSDVFSFGVLLLEIVSGKRNSSFYHPERHMNLLGYAWELWSENKMLDLLDPVLTTLDSETEVLRCIKVGLLCVQDSANHRPTMDTVMLMLGSEAAVIPTPMKPAFSTGRTPRETDVLVSSSKICSANAMTISAIYGR